MAKATPANANSNSHLPVHQAAEIVTGHAVANKAESKSLQAILAGLPSDVPSLKLLSRTCARNTASAMFEHGRVLLALKHRLDHGELYAHYEEIGIAPRLAQICMAFAIGSEEITKLTGGKLGINLLAELGATKARILVSNLLEAPADELPATKKQAESIIDQYAAMSVAQLKAELAKKNKDIATLSSRIEKGRKELREKDEELDSYKLSDDDAVRRACLRLQEGQLASMHEFQNTLEKHIPGGAKRKLTPEERIHLNATVEYLANLHQSVADFLFDHFPQITESSAADLQAAKRFVKQTAGAPPSLESKPEFLARVLDAVEADGAEDDEAPARNGKRKK